MTAESWDCRMGLFANISLHGFGYRSHWLARRGQSQRGCEEVQKQASPDVINVHPNTAALNFNHVLRVRISRIPERLQIMFTLAAEPCHAETARISRVPIPALHAPALAKLAARTAEGHRPSRLWRSPLTLRPLYLES
jgi:hypothetical protein